jgi:Na+/melibiose symporter-like transporter
MSFNRQSLLAYGFMGLPLAMVALPIYVQIPNYYATHLGLNLASIGLILFFVRLLDTALDPFIGHMIARSKHGLSLALLIGSISMAFSFYALWLPPMDLLGSKLELRMIWLSFFLCLVYLAHSLMQISFMAWGAQLEDKAQNTLMSASAWREGFGLVGIILASTIPSFILNSDASHIRLHLTLYIIAFIIVLILSYVALMYRAMPYRTNQLQSTTTSIGDTSHGLNWGAIKSLKHIITQPRFQYLGWIYFINSIAIGISASLVLFFINDYLLAAKLTPYFLASYFLAASIGLPLWVKLAKHWGTERTWQTAILLSVISFIGVLTIDANSKEYFYLICLGSGFALGADLALPPVMLSKLIQNNEAAAPYFGLWNFIAKLAVSCSGLSLALLAWLGYQPNPMSIESDLNYLAHPSLLLVYALLPCCFKLICFALLWKYPNEKS